MNYILILSHQGGSFVEKLSQAAKKTNLTSIILSSEVNEEQWDNGLGKNPDAYKTSDPNLNFENVTEFINEHGLNSESFKGVISVWEGYRPLMAALNNHYGFNDISEKKALLLRDKLKVRKLLTDSGLSIIRADIANEHSIDQRLKQRGRSFIKPRFGLGSVGAKELESHKDILYIETIRKGLRDDKLLGKAVSFDDFIVEDFIDGSELSAEVIIERGEVQVLAFHEKVETRYGLYTTTEPFCVAPPITNIDECAATSWLSNVFKLLKVHCGCYHVEFKVKNSRCFEIVEINPRVGGALIVESTNHVADVDILSKWISSLGECEKAGEEKFPLKDNKKQIRCAAFRVYFSQLCGKVEKLQLNACQPMPSVYNVLVGLGQELSREGSEQYLGQALWTSSARNKKDVVEFQNRVKNISRNFIDVDIKSQKAVEDVFIVVDYNLNRVDEVVEIAQKCNSAFGVRTVLLTSKGKSIAHELIISGEFTDVSSKSFIKDAVDFVKNKNLNCIAGVVFSDDAISFGPYILDHFGVWVDSPELALNSYDKLSYREAESEVELPEGVTRPVYLNIDQFSAESFKNQKAWIVKPRCEGNNRGVIKVNQFSQIGAALKINEGYLSKGLIVEECIDKSEEFSVDGVGNLSFITKKLSVSGTYPLEVGQVQPAEVTAELSRKIITTSSFANKLTGQSVGAFHNEIMICRKTGKALVVEPNRRPGGMQIWRLIKDSYGVDLYDTWLNTAKSGKVINQLSLTPIKRSGLLMLPGASGRTFQQESLLPAIDNLVRAVWIKVGVPDSDRPKHSNPRFLVEDGYIFNDQPVDGHGFMLTLNFQCPLEINLADLLTRFYAMWDCQIHILWNVYVSLEDKLQIQTAEA